MILDGRLPAAEVQLRLYVADEVAGSVVDSVMVGRNQVAAMRACAACIHKGGSAWVRAL